MQELNPDFLSNPNKRLSNLFGLLATNYAMLCNMFTSKEHKLLVQQCAMPDAEKKKLLKPNIRKSHTEQHVNVTGKMKQSIKEAQQCYGGIPFSCYNVDLHKNKINKKKCVGIRVSFELKGNFTSYVIGMREHNPSSYLQNNIRASAILGSWVTPMLHEFHVKACVTPAFHSEVADASLNETIPSETDNDVGKNDVLSKNGDGSPDVLRLNAKPVDVLAE